MAKAKEVKVNPMRTDEIRELSAEDRKRLFPTNPPLTLRELKELKTKKNHAKN